MPERRVMAKVATGHYAQKSRTAAAETIVRSEIDCPGSADWIECLSMALVSNQCDQGKDVRFQIVGKRWSQVPIASRRRSSSGRPPDAKPGGLSAAASHLYFGRKRTLRHCLKAVDRLRTGRPLPSSRSFLIGSMAASDTVHRPDLEASVSAMIYARSGTRLERGRVEPPHNCDKMLHHFRFLRSNV